MALKDIIGQKRAKKILKGIIKRDRIPSSLLFSGDFGIGKKFSAINFAKAINCLNPIDFDSCDKCLSCKKINADIHPDVYIITLKNMQKKLSLEKQYSGSEYPIEAIRKIEELLHLKIFEGKRKIFIIDDADSINLSAANAFLKTLEEPPKESTIILISENPDSLPETIRSRCINVRFYPLSIEETKKVISESVKAGDIDLLAKLSSGRPGVIISYDLMQKKERFEKLLSNMTTSSKEIWTDKEEMESWLDMALISLRDGLISSIMPDENFLIFKDSKLFHKKMANEVINIYQKLQGIKSALDLNLNKSITWNYVASIITPNQESEVVG
jgi:DNA polymerase-3 subunit delta'